MTVRVSDVMTRDVLTVGPDWLLADVARLMRDENIGALPVAEDGALIGIVTDRDLVVRGLADAPAAAAAARARDVMSGELLYCFEDQNVEEVLEGLGERRVRRIPVMDRQKHLVGMVTLNDLSQSASMNFAVSAQRRMSRPGLH